MSKYSHNITLERGSTSICSLNFPNNSGTGIHSPDQKTVSIASQGTDMVIVTNINVDVKNIKSSNFVTSGVLHNDASGVYSTSLIVDGDITVGTIANNKLAGAPTSSNTANTIVLRDASGNSSQGTLTLTGVTIPSMSTAGVIHNNASGVFSSSLIVDGDVSATAAIANSKLAGAPTSSNTANTIVLRDASGNSSQGTLTLTGVTIPSMSTAGVIHNNASGVFSSSLIVDGDITTSTIANNKLAGAPTSSNTPNTIVLRDGSGNSSHGTLTASGLILGSLTYPSSSVSNGSYILSAASNVLSLSAVAYSIVGYNNTTGYAFTTNSVANVFTIISANSNYTGVNSNVTQTTTGLTITTSGTYAIGASLDIKGVNAVVYATSFAKNSTTSQIVYRQSCPSGTANTMSAQVFDIQTLAATDTLAVSIAASAGNSNITVIGWSIIVFKIG
jgi:trimeric autotransporter adhesin